jgi:hypothetical protein
MVLKTKKMVFFSETKFERAVLNRARIDRCHHSMLPASSAQDQNFLRLFGIERYGLKAHPIA